MKHYSVLMQSESIFLSPYAMRTCSLDDMVSAQCLCHTLIGFLQTHTGPSSLLLRSTSFFSLSCVCGFVFCISSSDDFLHCLKFVEHLYRVEDYAVLIKTRVAGLEVY